MDAARDVSDPVSGQRWVFRRTGAETGGELLEADLHVSPGGFVRSHAHPDAGGDVRLRQRDLPARRRQRDAGARSGRERRRPTTDGARVPRRARPAAAPRDRSPGARARRLLPRLPRALTGRADPAPGERAAAGAPADRPAHRSLRAGDHGAWAPAGAPAQGLGRPRGARPKAGLELPSPSTGLPSVASSAGRSGRRACARPRKAG
jgi:hypothetical protein